MTNTQHLYQPGADDARIVDLMCRQAPATRHRTDLPWRLSSPANATGRDIMVWEAADGSLLGVAAWQVNWAALDFFVDPGPQQGAIETAIFGWAEERFRELDRERGRPSPYWVEYRDDDQQRLHVMLAHGFTLDND